MVKAGDATDAVSTTSCRCSTRATSWSTAETPYFEDTLRRQEALEEKGLHFVGMGVSGGEEGG